MPDLIQREHLDTDPVDCVKQQIKLADDARNPISRYGLAEIVSERTGMPLDEAKLLVEAYCEEHAAYIPAYLSNEFGLLWPKVVAFIAAIAGLGVFWYAMTLRMDKKPAWMWFAIGTIVFGLGVFTWVQNLESYKRLLKAKRAEREERLRAKYAKPR